MSISVTIKHKDKTLMYTAADFKLSKTEAIRFINTVATQLGDDHGEERQEEQERQETVDT